LLEATEDAAGAAEVEDDAGAAAEEAVWVVAGALDLTAAELDEAVVPDEVPELDPEEAPATFGLPLSALVQVPSHFWYREMAP